MTLPSAKAFNLDKLNILSSGKGLMHYCIMPTERKEKMKTNWEKKKNAGVQHCLVFPQCFLSYKTEISRIEQQ